MRTCKKCGEIKPLEDFPVYNKVKGWRRWECKKCIYLRCKAWNEAFKDRVRSSKRKYYEAHREEALARATKWNKANLKRRREIALAYYYRHKDKR